MAKSLTKLKEQIAKLQKEADSIQSVVILRIKREIALHGLTPAHLFGVDAGLSTGHVFKTAGQAKGVTQKSGVAKPPKYVDEHGNAWGGMGKRPRWIHTALAAGRSLDEFLVVKKNATGKLKLTPSTQKTARKTSGKALKEVFKKPAPSKTATAKHPTPVRVSAAVKKAPKRLNLARQAPAKNAPKARKSAKPGVTPADTAAA